MNKKYTSLTFLVVTLLVFSNMVYTLAEAGPMELEEPILLGESCDSYKYVTQWGTLGTGNGQFTSASGIATNSSGNIYVTDSWNNRIQQFTSDGTYINKWGGPGSGNGQFNYPQGIAVDSSGNVYVADTINKRIQKFTSNGVYITQWGTYGTGNGQFYNPFGITIDSSGNVYVADRDNHRIQKFTSNGTYITGWGTKGTGNGQFDVPHDVASDSFGNVYVADSLNNRIQKFTSNGTYITGWGTLGDGNGQFSYPAGITIDSHNDVYITDLNNRVQKFTSDGAYITQWGTLGSSNGQLYNPRGINIDALGNVYVVDWANNRIQKFDCATTPIPTPKITVTYPNGGEVFVGDQQITATWTSTDLPQTDQIQVDLIVADQNNVVLGDMPLALSMNNDGQEVITIPTITKIKQAGFPSVVAGKHFKIRVGNEIISPNISDSSDDFFTINEPVVDCRIDSFVVPSSTTIASRLRATVSWSSNCKDVVLIANSGSYYERYIGGASGTYTFISSGSSANISTKDRAMDITIIAGNDSDIVSQTKSVLISGITPASNQCAFSSVTATPNPVLAGSNQATLSWVAPLGCKVYIQAFAPTGSMLSQNYVFNPNTSYFNATDSVTVPISKSSTFYITAQAGSISRTGNTMVLSATTIDVKKK